jgi:hypothetical protein
MSDSPTPPAMPEMDPPCPKCGEPMKLMRVEPADEPGHDLRMFECKCGHTETREVTYK